MDWGNLGDKECLQIPDKKFAPTSSFTILYDELKALGSGYTLVLELVTGKKLRSEAIFAPSLPWFRFNQDSRPEAYLRQTPEGSRRDRGRSESLLGHKNGSVTSHYSGAELGQLIEAATRFQQRTRVVQC